MEKLISFLFICVLASCSDNDPAKKAHTQSEDSFPTDEYKQASYNVKVSDFINDNLTENERKDSDSYIFLNTKSCSGCTIGAFEEIQQYLNKATATHIIFINDSTIPATQPVSSNVKFRYFSKEKFEDAGVFHGKPYLYTIKHGTVTAIPLNGDQIDSLNSLP